jgi:hypothetical protein
MFVVAGPVAGASWRELHVSWLIRSRLSVIQRAAGQNRIMMKLAACQICQRVHSWRSFHCGCAPSIFRVAIVASLSMLAYESVLGIFRSGYIRTWRPALNWTSFSGWARYCTLNSTSDIIRVMRSGSHSVAGGLERGCDSMDLFATAALIMPTACDTICSAALFPYQNSF